MRNNALELVLNLSVSELPVIPGIPDAPENLRRVAGLHRELSRLCGGKKYFLTCRDAAKACPGLSHQKAYNINLALAQLGVIEVVRAGDPHPGGRASHYRYLADFCFIQARPAFDERQKASSPIIACARFDAQIVVEIAEMNLSSLAECHFG